MIITGFFNDGKQDSRSQNCVVVSPRFFFTMENSEELFEKRNTDLELRNAQNLADRLRTRLADAYRELDMQGPKLRQLARTVEQAQASNLKKDAQIRSLQGDVRECSARVSRMEMRAKKMETALSTARSKYGSELRKRDVQEEKLLRELRRVQASPSVPAPKIPTMMFQSHEERALVVFDNEQKRLAQEVERRLESLCHRFNAAEFSGPPIDRLEKAIAAMEQRHAVQLQQEIERSEGLQKKLWQMKEELDEKTALCKRDVETLEKWSQYVRDKDLLQVAGI